MKYLLVFLFLLLAVPARAEAQAEARPDVWPDAPLDMLCLREAYGAAVEGMEEDTQGLWLTVRGQRVLYALPPDMRPDPLSPQATVRQSMAQPYPLEPARPQPADGIHPGRVRSEALLRALYGADKAAVAAQLRKVTLAGKGVDFSANAGAAEALARVGAGLAELVRAKPELKAWVLPLGGTFAWRKVAGEQRLSPHSFGTAVDLNTKKGAYWRWSGGVSHPGQSAYPTDIVKLFEDNGFVWGGKWREYDLMHFEYRPEILCKARKLAARAE